jgi:peptidyl-dipeptidase Dcp
MTLAVVTAAVLAFSPAPAEKKGASMSTSPLLAPWTGPHGGVPPFDQVKVADFEAALEAGMADNLKEIDAIANESAAPTFDNTFVPLEKSGRPLGRATAMFGVWSGNLSTPDFRKVEEKVAPKLAAFNDQIVQNAKLFARIKAVYESPEKAKLTPEQQRLVWQYFTDFSRQGANLGAEQKAELSKLNQQLAGLYTKFSQNQLADEEGHSLLLEKRDDLDGLPESLVSAAAAEADRAGKKGKWVIANTRSSMEPFLTYSTRRELREKGFKMWASRGDNGDAHDNNAIVTEILQLRAKKAKLLGFPTYAHWQLSNTMAKDPKTAMALMVSVWEPAKKAFLADVADAQKIADKESKGVKIEPWDYRYYAEKVRKEKYDLDLTLVTPYLQLEHLRDAMFWEAGALYGLTFTKVSGFKVFNPDVEVYEVTNKDKAHVGYWYFDPYARPGKRSGAWMSAYREQYRFDGDVATIVSNNSNFNKGAKGGVTVSWDDARTMFHEFGHALHGLNSNVNYPMLSGTNTARDFVEFPSQFNENFLETPEVLKFLVNAKGEQIPAPLLERIAKARNFNQGFQVGEAQASAIVDMKLHLAGDTKIDPKAFEKTTLAEIGMPNQMIMRHRIPHFGHIFSGEGYAAGYYSYIWAEVLDHDAFEAFKEAGSPYDAATAKKLKDTIMSVGNTIDPAVAYRNFRGRDPKPDALLRSKGFPVAAAGK